ncbi:MAG: 30S ribosomal protein S11, partial [Gammaproteobacteria bacterium]
AQVSTENAIRRSLDYGIKQLEVILRGPGSGREMCLRAVQSFPISILSIKDVSPLPHNGCRPSKKRRV